MVPGSRHYESASLTVALPEAVPEHMVAQIRELLSITTPAADRRKGYASRLLREVVMEADSSSTVLLLWVRPFGDMTGDQLQAWYRKFGFEVIQQHPAVLMARKPRMSSVNRHIDRMVRQALH